MDEVQLERKQDELLAHLMEIQRSLPKAERQDFVYQQSLARVAGARPRADLEKAIDDGGFAQKFKMATSDSKLPSLSR